MARALHVLPADLHGLGRFAIDGVVATTDLVEHLHQAISSSVVPIGAGSRHRTSGITGLVYRSIRGVTRLVGDSLDLALEPIVQRLPASTSTPQRERALAIVNGIVGDHLDASGNPLALPLSIRHSGIELRFDSGPLLDARCATSRIAAFAHGLCMNEAAWSKPPGAHANLADALTEAGWTVLHVRYNSGRAVHFNGRELAERMTAIHSDWPVPIDRLALVGHSMGGLVWRSAVHQALASGRDWPGHVDSMVTLGTPHHGSPLERAGHVVDRVLEASRYGRPFTRLGRIRSAGIVDLRHGNVLDPKDGATPGTAPPVPVLPAGATCFAVAATLGERDDDLCARRLGDGLVPVPSALGQHDDPARCLPIAAAHRLVLTETGHLELAHHADVVRRVREWLE